MPKKLNTKQQKVHLKLYIYKGNSMLEFAITPETYRFNLINVYAVLQ